jgi:hypothetical protein
MPSWQVSETRVPCGRFSCMPPSTVVAAMFGLGAGFVLNSIVMIL